ncbi:hypothetical protein Goarm_008070 [Gossypium armourianum]|uniref:Uncharacterized protein n=1 Tax=Gossypium armourianum TaxID=34283 RepID=A0A7J9JNR2_9ROSI|nr:hypothetical protein [Gossypium armourianum]
MALTFKLAQLQSKATRASQLVSKHAPLYYKQLLEQNKHYIQDPPTVEKCNLLSKQLFYTRLARLSPMIKPLHCLSRKLMLVVDLGVNGKRATERVLVLVSSYCFDFCNLSYNGLKQKAIPSRYEAFQKEMDYVKLMWKKRNEWKIEDAGIAALFGLECFAWYCTGEIVGRAFCISLNMEIMKRPKVNENKISKCPPSILLLVLLRRKGILGIQRQSDSLAVSLKIDRLFADGRASTTASARSVMNEEVQPRAGTRPQFSIPDLRAKSFYSKLRAMDLIGTARRLFTPFRPSSARTSLV